MTFLPRAIAVTNPMIPMTFRGSAVYQGARCRQSDACILLVRDELHRGVPTPDGAHSVAESFSVFCRVWRKEIIWRFRYCSSEAAKAGWGVCPGSSEVVCCCLRLWGWRRRRQSMYRSVSFIGLMTPMAARAAMAFQCGDRLSSSSCRQLPCGSSVTLVGNVKVKRTS